MTEAARLFAEAEVKAERTVAALRIGIALLLGGSFLATVAGTAPTGATAIARQFDIAIATMVAYLALGILSRWLAGTDHFRPWMSWAFVTLDVAFIVSSLALGLANTTLSGNYLAALPSAWLAPLVLAFGALRYNPALQIYVTAILGIGLAATAAGTWSPMADRAGPPVLDFFFGGPPNAMRLVMLVAAGLVLVVAAFRARALLARAIDEARRRANLTRYLPPQIAATLSDSGVEAARAGRRQMVAVLFADIRGFTTMAETMDPTELGRFVGEFRQLVARAVDAHGGVIDKFIGDAALVVFGVPAARPDDARRAVDCARTLLIDLAAWNAVRVQAQRKPIAIGIGAHWGEAFCGAVGDDSRLEFTVLGDTVNVAARVEAAAKTVDCALLVSEDLLAASGDDAGAWRRLPPQPLRGRSQPVTLFALNA